MSNSYLTKNSLVLITKKKTHDPTNHNKINTNNNFLPDCPHRQKHIANGYTTCGQKFQINHTVQADPIHENTS